MLQQIIRQLVDDVTDGVKHDVEAYTNRILRRMMRGMVIGGVGVTFVAAGSVFVLIGLVAYLSRFMFSGFAWGLVGLVVVLVGGLMLLLIRR